MKEKEAVNVEDVLAQLNNSRTQHNALISLFNRLKSAKISNVQRTRLLKTVAHTLKDGNSTDLRVAALSSVLPWVVSSNNAASGADFHLLEACTKIVLKYVANPTSQHIDIVAKALEIMASVNVATLVKLFGEDDASRFNEIMIVCLKLKELRLPALTLLAVGLSVPSSEGLGKTISEDVVPLIQLVYPLIFDLEDVDVHFAALRVMKGLKLTTKPQPFWNQLKGETQTIYCKRMVEMVNCKSNWPEVWKCIVNLFGEELHSGGQLINHMLEVLERAFKHADFEWTRVQAFECWNTLIDNFKTGLKNRKRIDLIMIPLKANNHRIETLAMAKLKTYDHLLATLGKDLASSPDILTNFLTFCFGSEKTSCPPVKSYPALHDKCVECILNILVSPFGEEMFKKAQKELVTAVGDCFVLDSASEALLSELWNRLLERVWKQEGTDAVKTLFSMINTLVVRAGNKEISGSLKLQETISSSKPTSEQINEVLGSKIVGVIVHGLVLGAFSVPENLFKMRSLYVGSYDVMNGTPTLLMMEWLLSPALMLSAGSLPLYDELVSKLLKHRCQELDGYIEFTQLVLKKLLVFDESLSSDKKQLMYKCATQSWCTIASGLIRFIQKEGSINQGDAAEHDFSGIYSVLLFPIQSLHVDISLIEKCTDPWSNLFYEVCQQAELIPTASLQLVCEQVCIRLLGASKKNSPMKQHASVYLFLTCILEVASKRFKSKKSFKFVEQQISTILKDMNGVAFDQAVIFDQATNCIQHFLKQTPISMEVVENVSPTVCSLLKAQINTSDAVDKLCTLIGALKEASLFISQHGVTKGSVYAMLKNVIDVGNGHTSQEIRAVVDDLCQTFNDKISEGEEKSQSVKNKGAFSPSSRFNFSPKPASKKFPTVQMSPSNLSPGGSKRKPQATVCGSDGKFVRIETPTKKIILTDHQKEVRRERRQDIPALYQDLSQDTQSMSQDSTQDFVALPATPKGKCAPALDEDAIMDVVKPNTPMQAISAKKIASPKSTKKSHVDSEPRSELKDFTPPVGFILPSIADDTKSVTDADSQDPSEGLRQEGKENESGASNSKALKGNKAPQKGTLTRSSSNTSLTTRSGKIMKRASIAGKTEVLKKRKYTRKSLPAIFSEEPVKKGVEMVVIESDTDTESVSSIASDACGTTSKAGKSILRPRRSFKREPSLESDTEIMAAREKVRESPQNGTDKLSKDVFKRESSKIKVGSDTEHTKSDPEDVPLSQLIGGKILTRSRSNSSLDDVAVVKKSKTSSPDSKHKSMSPVSELTPKPKGSPPLENGWKSPQKKTTITVSKIEISPNNRRNRIVNLAAFDSAVEFKKIVNTAEGDQITTDNSKSFSPTSLGKLKSVLFQDSSSLDDKPCVEKEKQAACAGASSLSTSLHIRKELNGLNDHENMEFDNGTEESQEIIESSQEPILKCLKPCLVSLEHFRCTEANKTVEFENLTLEKGPAPNSPYKILSKDSSPVEAGKQTSACRRSLILDGAENSLSSMSKEVVSPPKPPPPAETRTDSVNGQITSDNASKKLPFNAELENKGTIKTNLNKEGKEQDLSAAAEGNHVRNDSMPEWMHDKKDSPLTKSQRTIRGTSARSQAFMKSVADSGNSTSPPKAADVSPISSPGQSKRSQKPSIDSNTTPIIKRSSRAAQLLGLGQAAAARGGDTVVSSASRSLRMDKTGDNEKTETLSNIRNSTPSSSIASSAASSVAAGVMGSVSAVTTVASPSVRRHKLLDLDSLKCTPQKCLEDKGNKEDWVRKDWVPTATPDASILKRKREVDSDAPSPSVKRKRVSFRDPPFSTLLRFGETSEGTVFTSDQPAGIDRVSEAVNLDREECAPMDNNEVETEEQPDQPGEPLSFEMEPKLNGKGSSQEKDSVMPVENSSGGTSPQESDSVSHGREGIANVVEVKSPKSRSEALSGQNGSKDAAFRTSAHDGEGEAEMDVDLCKCDNTPVEGGSEEPETQGMLDDLHRMPSILTPVYANLTDCTHSVELISSNLTSAVWKKSLLRELSEGGIRTVGDLARLTEEQLDRLPVKPPKRTNVCRVLEDFEKLHSDLTDGVSCQLLKTKITTSGSVENSLEDLLTNTSNEDIIHALSKAGTKLDFSKALVESLPPEDVVKFLKLEDLIKFFSLEELIPFFKLKDLIKFFTLEELLKFFKLEDVVQLFKLEDVIQLYKPEDVIRFYKPGEVVKHFKTEDVINSLKAEDVSRAVASNSSVIRSLHVDVCAEAYISQVNKSSGSKEKEMSVEQLTSILNRIPGGTIQSTMFPSTPTLLSTVYTDTMRDYVMRECSSSEIVQKLDGVKANECVLKLLPKLDNDKAKECGLKLLPKLGPEDIAQELDSTKATELTAKLLSKFSPSVIAEQIENNRVEETIEALLLKLNKKRRLGFLLDKSVHVYKQLE
ncbi:telomere-associated protein RIF1-like [Thrips palmi]|uniref:Telomere-associated protein RIF1-like n=1 Tax=Thrips palmi TaxID=161013 RepID=A0A6P8YJ70_THRPL|nr:telomere-associated protein RIF1-like [Thrips palmi]